MINEENDIYIITNIDTFIRYLEQNDWPKHKSIQLEISNRYIGICYTKRLLDAFQAGSPPKELIIDLSNNIVTRNSAINIANLIASGKLPPHTFLNLSDNEIDDVSAYALAEALKNAPEGFCIDLTSNKISDFGVKQFALAIKNNLVPNQCSIDLSINHFSSQAGRELVKSVNADKYVKLILQASRFGDEGMRSIAQRLVEIDAPKKLSLQLSNNGIGNRGFSYLTDVFYKHHISTKISLDLSNNLVGLKGISYLANALEQGCVPHHFKLNLDNNNVTDEGIRLLANALISPKARSVNHFRLSLKLNKISNIGISSLIEALEKGFFPPNLELNLSSNDIDDELLKQFNLLLRRNETLLAAVRCLMVLKERSNPISPISLLYDDALIMIFNLVFPYTEKKYKSSRYHFVNNVFHFFNHGLKRNRENEDEECIRRKKSNKREVENKNNCRLA